MNAIVSIATAASVLVHAVFGCCAHHAHNGKTACCVRQTVEKAAPSKPSACCQHGHKHAFAGEAGALAQHSDSKSAPLPQSPCDEGRCTAVLASKSDSVAPVLGICLLQICSLEHVAVFGNESIRVSYASEQHHLGPPLRPHLCNLVLLI